LELDEDDPDRFHLSKGPKRALEVFIICFYFIISLAALFFISAGILIKDCLVVTAPTIEIAGIYGISTNAIPPKSNF
jgi:hypothetical protein